MVPYTQNVNYLSVVRLAACNTWGCESSVGRSQGRIVRGRAAAAPSSHCLGGMAKTGAPCSHYVACDTVNDYMNAEEKPCCHVQLFAHFLNAAWLPTFPTFPAWKPKWWPGKKNSPCDVKIFATNVLVPTWWKSPPALVLCVSCFSCPALFPTLVFPI